MKVSITTKALLLSLSLIGVSAQAHNLNWGNNPSWSMSGQNGQQRANPYSAPQNRPDAQWQAQHSRQAQKYGHNNGINSPNHKFYRGGQLPAQYRGDRGQRYVIVNWHDHRGLYEPPVGMRWNYIDGRYILATIATGIIYNIIYGS